jgi:hypothetical protein
LVGILDRMQREGWVERQGCQHDRRRKQIRLRQGAVEVWSKVVDCLQKVRQQASHGLSDDEVELLKRLLCKVQSNLSGTRALASSPGTRKGTRRRVGATTLPVSLGMDSRTSTKDLQPDG